MDAVMHFWALIAIAYAIYTGLHAIAAAIRHREVNVRFADPVTVVFRREDGPST